mmetsp:Transcript_8500/g.14301  ORF Transcript_8500/g.14301 Transcript_8500/m.14301 type:complete len:366 (+) Transcript_8500:982-2079(+)
MLDLFDHGRPSLANLLQLLVLLEEGVPFEVLAHAKAVSTHAAARPHARLSTLNMKALLVTGACLLVGVEFEDGEPSLAPLSLGALVEGHDVKRALQLALHGLLLPAPHEAASHLGLLARVEEEVVALLGGRDSLELVDARGALEVAAVVIELLVGVEVGYGALGPLHLGGGEVPLPLRPLLDAVLLHDFVMLVLGDGLHLGLLLEPQFLLVGTHGEAEELRELVLGVGVPQFLLLASVAFLAVVGGVVGEAGHLCHFLGRDHGQLLLLLVLGGGEVPESEGVFIVGRVVEFVLHHCVLRLLHHHFHILNNAEGLGLDQRVAGSEGRELRPLTLRGSRVRGERGLVVEQLLVGGGQQVRAETDFFP